MSTFGRVFSDSSQSEITSRSEFTGFPRDHASSVTSTNAATNPVRPSRHSKSLGPSAQRQVRIDVEVADANALSGLENLIARLIESRDTTVYRAVRKILKPALNNVEQLLEEEGEGLRSQLGGSTLAPEDLDQDLSGATLSYPSLLDEYMDKIGELDLAKERFETFVLELREDAERQERFGQTQPSELGKEMQDKEEENEEEAERLVESLQSAFSEVKIWEQRCIGQNLLSQARDMVENFMIIMDASGRREERSFLRPSETWHERFAAGEFEIQTLSAFELPLPPKPPPPPLSSMPPVEAQKVSDTGMDVQDSKWQSPTTLLPHPINAVIRETLQSCLGTSDHLDVYTIFYKVEWDVPIFSRAHMPQGSQLGSFFTITGGETEAFATSCREYITLFWKKGGLLLLDAVEKMLANLENGLHNSLDESDKGPIKITLPLEKDLQQRLSLLSLQQTLLPGSSSSITDSNSYVSEAIIEVRATFTDQLDIAATISWICSAIRHSPGGLTLSEPTFSFDSMAVSQNPCIRITPTYLLKRASVESCWHALFKHQVIASGFSIPERKMGKGLEISYGNMVTLAQSLELVKVHEGLIIEGITTLLIPTKSLGETDGNGVQWHLVMKTSNPSPDNYDSILPASWYQEADDSILSNQRAFLGWVPTAVVLAGTSHSNTSIAPSRLPEIPKSKMLWSRGGSVAINFKPVTVAGSATATFSSITPAIPIEDESNINPTLRNAAEIKHVILYDNEAQIAWQISRASLILYLAHIHIARRREAVIYTQSKAYPAPSSRGGMASYHAIRDSWESEIPSEVEAIVQSVEQQKFSWLIKKLLFRIQKIEEGLMKTQYEASKWEGMRAPKTIIGVELLDLAFFDDLVLIKTKEVNQAWAHLTDEEPLVFFGRRFGQVIVPSPSYYLTEALCPTWSRIPENENYLVAMACTIMSLFESKGSEKADIRRLAPLIRWHFNPKLPIFTLHRYDERSICNHIQRLESTGSVDKRSESKIRDVVARYPNAAFIFWDRGKTLRKKVEVTVRRTPQSKSAQPPTSQSPASAALNNVSRLPHVYPDDQYQQNTNRRVVPSILSAASEPVLDSQEISSSESDLSSTFSSGREDSDLQEMPNPVQKRFIASERPLSSAQSTLVATRTETLSVASGSTALGISSNGSHHELQNNVRNSPRPLRREVRSIQGSVRDLAISAEKRVIHQPVKPPQLAAPTNQRRDRGGNSSKTHLSRHDRGLPTSSNRQSRSSRSASVSERQRGTEMGNSIHEGSGRQGESSSSKRRRHSVSTATRDNDRQQENGKQDKGKKIIK